VEALVQVSLLSHEPLDVVLQDRTIQIIPDVGKTSGYTLLAFLLEYCCSHEFWKGPGVPKLWMLQLAAYQHCNHIHQARSDATTSLPWSSTSTF
jgi:hypothetical protein